MKTQTRTIKSESDAKNLIAYIGNIETYPYMVKVSPGDEKRSDKQNRLSFQWYKDAGEQGDQTEHECRAMCKLHFGCKILYQEDEYFREKYDQVLRPMTYEQKLAVMLPPFDLSVTSIMTVKQKTKYLDMIWEHYRGLGYILTDPSLLGLEDWRA